MDITEGYVHHVVDHVREHLPQDLEVLASRCPSLHERLSLLSE